MGILYGRPFGTEREVTQGEPVSQNIFNIVVDAVVRVVLPEVCSSQEAQHGLGWAAVEYDIVLYAENVRIAGCNPIWV